MRVALSYISVAVFIANQAQCAPISSERVSSGGVVGLLTTTTGALPLVNSPLNVGAQTAPLIGGITHAVPLLGGVLSTAQTSSSQSSSPPSGLSHVLPLVKRDQQDDLGGLMATTAGTPRLFNNMRGSSSGYGQPTSPLGGLTSLPLGGLDSAAPLGRLTSAAPLGHLTSAVPLGGLTSALPTKGLTSTLPLVGGVLPTAQTGSSQHSSPISGLSPVPLGGLTSAFPTEGLTSTLPLVGGVLPTAQTGSSQHSSPISGLSHVLPLAKRDLQDGLGGLMGSTTSALPLLNSLGGSSSGHGQSTNPLGGLTSALPIGGLTSAVPVGGLTSAFPIGGLTSAIPLVGGVLPMAQTGSSQHSSPISGLSHMLPLAKRDLQDGLGGLMGSTTSALPLLNGLGGSSSGDGESSFPFGGVLPIVGGIPVVGSMLGSSSGAAESSSLLGGMTSSLPLGSLLG